jgi:hypothetical protein
MPIDVSIFLTFCMTCLLIELTPGPNMAYLAIISSLLVLFMNHPWLTKYYAGAELFICYGWLGMHGAMQALQKNTDWK